MKSLFAFFAALGLMAAAAQAANVDVTITGNVFFNGINNPPLNAVGGGETAELSFSVDSNNFVDGVPGDTRGYVIDQSSFSLKFSGGTDVGLLNPFPAGQTPYFTLVDGFPVSDGFFVAASPISPGGVALEQTPFNLDVDLGYDGATLSSLNILDAVGTYDFTGLTRFSYNVWTISPDNVALGIDFSGLSIVPEPSALVLLAPIGLLLLRRRK